MRNIGVAFAHSLISYKSCLKGLNSISPNKEKILKDLNSDWSILTEALQIILRKEERMDAYENVAKLSRGKKMSKENWLKLIQLTKPKQKDILEKLTPEKYTGLI